VVDALLDKHWQPRKPGLKVLHLRQKLPQKLAHPHRHPVEVWPLRVAHLQVDGLVVVEEGTVPVQQFGWR
jgi:hypothetical protein